MRNDLITLITQYTEDNEIKRERKDDIFTERKSVTRAEYYSAYASGLSPRYVFNMSPDDYECAAVRVTEDEETREYLPSHLIYNGITYEIIRTFKKNDESLEVTVR